MDFPSRGVCISGCSTLHIAKYSLGQRECGCISTLFPRLPVSAASPFGFSIFMWFSAAQVPPEQGSENCSVNQLLWLMMFHRCALEKLSYCALRCCCLVLKISRSHSKIRANQPPPNKASRYRIVKKDLREELRGFAFLQFLLCLLVLISFIKQILLHNVYL